MTVWVGGEERPAFLDQARWLAEAWQADVTHVVSAGQHHFTVIEDMVQEQSALTKAFFT